MAILMYGQPRKFFMLKDLVEVRTLQFNYRIQWQPRFVRPEAMLTDERP